MKYREGFTDQQYEVMLLREHEKQTFKEIGARYGLSSTRARQLYNKAKLIQERLYLAAIYAQFSKKIYRKYEVVRARYNDRRIEIAFLEETYTDILEPFREGEPPSVFCTEGVPRRPHNPRIGVSPDRTKLRSELTPQEEDVLNEIDRHGRSIADIAAMLDSTDKDAYYFVRTANLCRSRALIKGISEKTGLSYDDVDRRVGRKCRTLNDKIAFLREWLGQPSHDKSHKGNGVSE